MYVRQRNALDGASGMPFVSPMIASGTRGARSADLDQNICAMLYTMVLMK